MTFRYCLGAVFTSVVVTAQVLSAATTPPNTPGSVSVLVLSATSVRVSWVDTNNKEKGYTIERNQTGVEPFTLVADTKRNSTSHVDAGLSEGITYYYRIRARGKSKTVSPWSTPLPVTTSNQPPAVDGGPDQVAVTNTAVSFTGSAVDPEGFIVSYEWDFGDGSGTANTANASHAYTAPGIYNAVLSVTDGASEVGTDTVVIHVGKGEFLDDFVYPSGSLTIKDMAVDSEGGYAITGAFSGTVNFGVGSHLSQGADDIFIARFDADGVAQWSKSFGDDFNEAGTAVAIDADGNVVFTGLFPTGRTLTIGTAVLTSSGGFDVFVALLDPAGNVQWVKSVGGGFDDYSVATAFDSSGNVALTGSFGGAVDFGGGPLTSAGVSDVYIASYAFSNGAHQWSRRFGSGEPDDATDIAADSAGHLAVSGTYWKTVNMGGGPRNSAGATDAFVAIFDASSGEHLHSKRFGGKDFDEGRSVTFDSQGNVLLTGMFRTTIEFGKQKLTNTGTDDMFLVKLTPELKEIWSQGFGTSSGGLRPEARAVAVDPLDNVLLAGTAIGSIDFGSGAVAAGSGSSVDPVVAKFRSTGESLWAKRFVGTSFSNLVAGVGAQPDGRVLVAGSFTGSMNFGGGSVGNASGSDGFVVNLER